MISTIICLAISLALLVGLLMLQIEIAALKWRVEKLEKGK